MYVFFHGGCMDGLGALWAFKKAHNVAFTPVPMVAGSKLDRGIFEGVKQEDRQVAYFLDVSPHKEDVEFLEATFSSVFIIDHHVLDKANYPSFKIIHDINLSGATLTWKLYFGEESTPTILKYVQDRDIWTWKLPDSKAVSEYLFKNVKCPRNPFEIDASLQQFEQARELLDSDLEEVVKKGTQLIEISEAQITSLMKMARKARWDDKYTVYHCPTQLYRSEIGARLMENKDADFSICWSYSIEKDEFWLSLRSNSKRTDVSAIAKAYGGGGHVQSSGCSLKYEDFKRVLKPFEDESEGKTD